MKAIPCLGSILLLVGFPAMGQVPQRPQETTATLPPSYSASYLRETAILFPPTSVIKDLGDGRVLARLSRTSDASTSGATGPIRTLNWLPDRSAAAMKSSLWIEDDTANPDHWTVQMTHVDGSTTSVVNCRQGVTRTRTELAPIRPGMEVMVDEISELGTVRPLESLDIINFRPGRFEHLVGGDGGCPMTAVYQWRDQTKSTTTLMADLGTRGLLSVSTDYPTGTVSLVSSAPLSEGSSKYWPSRYVEKVQDPDGTLARVTTYSLIRLDVRERSRPTVVTGGLDPP